jgi:protein Mpv17
MSKIPPLLKAALTSCTVMSAGDALFQAIRCHNANKEIKVDLKEAGRMALIGFTLHGPLVYSAFRWLEKSSGGASNYATFRNAAKYAVIGHLTFFPLFSTAFFTYMGLLEGLTLRECKERVEHTLPPTIVAGTAFWPAITVVNFMYVPPAARVLYVNGAGLFWNAYLSYENAAEAAVGHAAEKEKAATTTATPEK